ncbi:MAG TPA: hypothetical protein VIX89_18130 [Bryobacteraceae bacterium]
MTTRLLAAILIVCTVAFAGDWEFDRIVGAIESQYGAKRTHIPFMGLANLAVKVVHPAGASGFKLAVFEDLKSSRQDRIELDRFMNRISGGGLQQIVRVHSRRNGESTYIFMGDAGKSTKMLIATFERNEATVVEVKVNMDTLLKMIDKPEHAGRSFNGKEDW